MRLFRNDGRLVGGWHTRPAGTRVRSTQNGDKCGWKGDRGGDGGTPVVVDKTLKLSGGKGKALLSGTRTDIRPHRQRLPPYPRS